MNVYWILTILLCLSSAANMITSHNYKLRTFHVVRVSVNSTASVSCPNLTGKDQEEMRFHIHFGLIEVGNHTHDNAHNHNSTETVSPVGEGLGLRVNEQDHTVSFVLSGMTTEHAGVSNCEGHPMYPPPIEKVPDEPHTLVLVEVQSQKPYDESGSHEDRHRKGRPKVTSAAEDTFIRLRLRRVECSQSDYMSTKPRHPIRMGRY
uniref:Uncharacterized protein n=1 Tax=Hucho hucho TaxID=62062 RepID=A0A4W5MS82_9TELE